MSISCQFEDGALGREISLDDTRFLNGKRAEWIPCGDGENTPLMCSACCNTWPFYKQRGSKYCPNCGAKMINPWR